MGDSTEFAWCLKRISILIKLTTDQEIETLFRLARKFQPQAREYANLKKQWKTRLSAKLDT